MILQVIGLLDISNNMQEFIKRLSVFSFLFHPFVGLSDIYWAPSFPFYDGSFLYTLKCISPHFLLLCSQGKFIFPTQQGYNRQSTQGDQVSKYYSLFLEKISICSIRLPLTSVMWSSLVDPMTCSTISYLCFSHLNLYFHITITCFSHCWIDVSFEISKFLPSLVCYGLHCQGSETSIL